jgi:hypothetical protein
MPERLLLRTRFHSKRLLLRCRDAHFTNEEEGYEKKRLTKLWAVADFSTRPSAPALSVLHFGFSVMQLAPSMSASLTKEERDRMTPAQVIEEFKKGNYPSSWVTKFERM